MRIAASIAQIDNHESLSHSVSPSDMTAENERSERKSVNFKSRISFQVIWASWDSLPGLPYRICVRKGVESDILSSMTQKRKSTSKVYVNCLLVH